MPNLEQSLELLSMQAKSSGIVAKDVKGEPRTGYESSDSKGPFECANCEYSSDGTCRQPVMVKYSKQPRTKDGLVKIDPHGCCEYVDRIGK